MEGKHQDKRMRREFAKAMQALGDPPYILLSSVTAKLQPWGDAAKAPRSPRALGTLELSGSPGRCYHGSKGWTKIWRRTPEADMPKGAKFFVPIKDRVVLAAKKLSFYRASEFTELVGYMRQSKVFPQFGAATRVFGLTPGAVEKLAKGQTEWVNLLDHIADNAQSAISDTRALELSILRQPFTCPHHAVLRAMLDNEAEWGGSPLLHFARSYAAAAKSDKQAKADAELIRTLEAHKLYSAPEALNFSGAWNALVREMYPMLGLDFNEYSGGPLSKSGLYKQTVLEYIKLMDNQRKAVTP